MSIYVILNRAKNFIIFENKSCIRALVLEIDKHANYIIRFIRTVCSLVLEGNVSRNIKR